MEVLINLEVLLNLGKINETRLKHWKYNKTVQNVNSSKQKGNKCYAVVFASKQVKHLYWIEDACSNSTAVSAICEELLSKKAYKIFR